MVLARSGIPWEIAIEFDDHMRQGLAIIAGELEGGVFNWSAMAFEEPKS